MSQKENVLIVTVGDESTYQEGKEAIRRMSKDEPVEEPSVLSFADEEQLAEVFDGHAYSILRVIRNQNPGSIRETARLLGRDIKNVHRELSRLEALGVIRFEEEGAGEEADFPVRRPTDTPFRQRGFRVGTCVDGNVEVSDMTLGSSSIMKPSNGILSSKHRTELPSSSLRVVCARYRRRNRSPIGDISHIYCTEPVNQRGIPEHLI